MVVYAVYNSKGGVGKTAAAVNLAYLASVSGYRVLLWDLDPQASATFYCRIKPKLKGGVQKLLKGNIAKRIKETQYNNLHVLPADFSERNLDIILEDTKKSKKKLRASLSELEDDYDIVMLDCHPGLSSVSEHVFDASDYVLVPLIPTTLSIRTFEQIDRYFSEKGAALGKILPFFSLVDMRKKVHKEVFHAYINANPAFLQEYIPYASEVEKMGVRQAPLPSFSRKSKAVLAYHALWEEVRERTLPQKKLD
ncbi:MAG: ParA family protein [Spirochaetia bacterium]